MNFAPKPNFRVADRSERIRAAMEQPFTWNRALGENIGQGILDSFGLGTAVRDFAVPRGETAPLFPEPSPLTGGDFGPYGLISNAYEGLRNLVGLGDEPSKVLSEDEYKASPFFRDTVPFDPGMTEDRAKALADFADLRAVRAHFSQKQPIAAFAGQLLGQAFDPINYVPVFGPAARVAAVARLGGLKGRALLGASEAAVNTAAFGVLTAKARERLGDDVSFNVMAMEIAMSALIGGAFGTGIALLPGVRRADAVVIRERLNTVSNTQRAAIPLNDAIDGLATDGEVRLSPNGIDVVERVRAEVVERTARVVEAEQPRVIGQTDFQARLTAAGNDLNVVTSNLVAEVDKAIRDGATVTYHVDSGKRPVDIVAVEDGMMTDAEGQRWSMAELVETPGSRVEIRPQPRAEIDVPQTKIATEVSRNLDPHARGRRPNLTPDAQREIDAMPPRIRDLAGKPDDPDYPEFLQWLDATARMNGEPEPSRQPRADRQGIGQDDGGGQPAVDQPDLDLPRPIDMTGPKPEPVPEGLAEAEARVGRPEAMRDLADQHGVDLTTGEYVELADIEQLREQGRLSPEDDAELAAADEAYDVAESYGQTLKAALSCVV